MGNTARHVILGCLWFHGFLLAAAGLFRNGALSSSPLPTALTFVVWTLGMALVFASWAWRDAPTHGKSRKLAVACAAGWCLVFCFAAVPYFVATRGAKRGSLAGLKFLALCAGLPLSWIVIPAIIVAVA